MFPFDQPAATTSYVLWYLVTLVLHVLPMNYVLAGSTYLAALGLWEAVVGPSERQRPIAELLRSWLPFALGIAITAAVAPLLFLQILYRREFYTANLLLFNRWMAILPVLIVAFYLLYVQKSDGWTRRPAWLRAGVSLGIALCFAFVGWSWTENHLLSLQTQSAWTTKYQSTSWFFFHPELIPRLSVWYFGAFAALATALGWHLRRRNEANGDQVRTLAALAVSGTLAATAAAVVYWFVLPVSARDRLLRTDGVVAAGIAAAAASVQVGAWIRMAMRGQASVAHLATATGGVVLATLAATLLRELRRVAAVDLSSHAAAHADAARVDGLFVFLAFFVVNLVVIVGVVVTIRRGLRQTRPNDRGLDRTVSTAERVS